MAEKKEKKKVDEPSAPAWMVTYGDLMGLLLTFFVLLLSFSTINEQDFREAIASLQGYLGVLSADTGLLENMNASRPIPRTPRSIERLARELERRMKAQEMESQIGVELDEERGGVQISLPSSVLFDSGSADLRTEAYGMLQEIVSILKDVPQAFIEVRGHTDDRPLSSTSRYADNWDLSYHRAKTVMFYLQRQGQMQREQFEAIACGPSQPVATNATQEGRQANRRVELFVRGSFDDEARQDLIDGVRSLDDAGAAGDAESPDATPERRS